LNIPDMANLITSAVGANLRFLLPGRGKNGGWLKDLHGRYT
jgi:hypothetical protein